MSEELLCDWCALPFAENEMPVEGYENKPTHRKCRRFALRAKGRDIESDWYWRTEADWYWRDEREPFCDWPNGQGTYD